jgi:2-keto-4-pentenoate hydratase/2-oxohepta-3-ene-1,7-dioic acid hydratase in catechol pathway
MKILRHNGFNANKQPIVSLIADSAIIRENRPVFMPDFAESWQSKVMPAIRICRLGLNIAPKFANRYYDAFTLVHQLIPNISDNAESATMVSFDGALAIGEWVELPTDGKINIEINGQSLTIEEFDRLCADTIHAISQYMTMKNGDLILFGQQSIDLDAKIDTTVTATANGNELLNFKLK